MAYFKWVGTDIVGAIKKGKQAAYSADDLSERLVQRGIALLWCKSMHTPSFLWPITHKKKGDLFKQQAQLLRAGVLLPTTLEIIAQQAHNPIIYDILFKASRDIQHGVPFGKAFEHHTVLSDPLVTVMLTAGHESGNILSAVENVALYYHKQHLFNQSIRSALAMPLLTLLFFIGISCFIFICIIPRFADMFSSLQQDLPSLTRSMIEISDFIRSSAMLYVVGAVGVILFVMYRYCTTLGKKSWDATIAYIPFVGVAMWQHQVCQAFHALSLLVNSGVSLVSALKIVSESIDNFLVKSQFGSLHDEVASGQLLSNAMAVTSIFLPEVLALIRIGEETGSLGQSLETAALMYNDKLEELLRRFVFFLQPVVIVVLGLLVSTLILAVYLPIMQLSYAL